MVKLNDNNAAADPVARTDDNDDDPYNQNVLVLAKSDTAPTPTKIDMRCDSNFRMLALVNVASNKCVAKYNKRAARVSADNQPPCPMFFLADGVSEAYVRLMRGLQYVDRVDAAELLTLAHDVPLQHMWVRSAINCHTPLEAAIAAGFNTEFGSEAADAVAKVLIRRGAPLSLAYPVVAEARGGPTSSPLHMLMAKGDFKKTAELLRVAVDAGRMDGTVGPPPLDALFISDAALKRGYVEADAPVYYAMQHGHLRRLLQSPVMDLMIEVHGDLAIEVKALLAAVGLRAADLGSIAKDVPEFSAMFTHLYEAQDQAETACGLPLHRAADLAAASGGAIPVKHATKLLEVLSDSVVRAVDGGGRTCLHAALEAGNVGLVQAIVARMPSIVGVPKRTQPTRSAEFDARFEELRKSAIRRRSTR